MESTRANLETIFSLVSDAILVTDEQGYVAAANPAAVKLTGFSIEEMIGKIHICNLCKGMATSMEEATCSGCFTHDLNVPSFEMKIRTKAGDELPVSASSTCLPTSAGKQLVMIMRDMSEQKKMEHERYWRQLTNYVIQVQEEERKRVSKDLHDGVGQALYSILVGLKVLDQLDLESGIKARLEDVRQLTARVLNEVNTIAVELRPFTLDDLGLLPAIRSYRKRYEQTFGIESKLETKGDSRRYASSVETALYRICQEAMINAAKYADTDFIEINLEDLDGKVTLTISDNGKGFDADQMLGLGTSLGLYGMKERAGLLGGTVTIQSAPGKGTTVQATIPLTEKGEPRYVDPGTYSR